MPKHLKKKNMKKILSIMSIFAVMVIAGTTSVKAENYLVNDEAVEASFTAAVAAPMSVDFINAIIPNVISNILTKM